MEEKVVSLDRFNEDLATDNKSFTPEIPDTKEIPIIKDPDDREYEDVKIEVEGGV